MPERLLKNPNTQIPKKLPKLINQLNIKVYLYFFIDDSFLLS